MRYLEGIATKRRYARSINLERDLDDHGVLDGYVVTARAHEALELFYRRFVTPSAVRAFTMTAVYGAGKSAFMHFLLSLLSNPNSLTQRKALSILRDAQGGKKTGDLYRFFAHLNDTQPSFLRLVAVSRQESIGMTIARALYAATAGISRVHEKAAHAVAHQFIHKAQTGKPLNAVVLIEAIQKLANYRPIIIAIDELGKNLEQASFGENDVFLLQLLAELPQQKFPIFFFGLLHSAFSDYAGRLGARERTEWQKIQGRFEDIPFLDNAENTLQLIAAAIEQKPAIRKIADRVGAVWQKKIGGLPKIYSKVFPLHPWAARALPILCARFGQNERSLFNYLTGHEPHSFNSFLADTPLVETEPRLLRLADLYAYFIKTANLYSIERQSRLVELRDRVRANEHLDLLAVEALKTIAILNALAVGELKASREIAISALQNYPGEREKEIAQVLDQLVASKIITYRKQADEYRLWSGSEYEVESLIQAELAQVSKNLAGALNAKFSLRSIVAARHSFETGTLRYFAAFFVDDDQIGMSLPNADGYILYDISESERQDEELPYELNTKLAIAQNMPIIRLRSNKTKALRTVARELLALESLLNGRQSLSLDSVAKREISERYYLMAERLSELMQREFALGKSTRIVCTPRLNKDFGTLSQVVSHLCDAVYNSGFKLRNELINRQVLTSQIAKARGEIVSRLLQYREHAAEHFSGNGPEVSIFRVLTEPKYQAELEPARRLIADFAEQAKDATPLSQLFSRLSAPPYGIRQGIIPLLLVQYLLQNEESVSLYQDGSFIPEITPELLEILVRRPERFSLKKFTISALQAQYLQQLLDVYGASASKKTLLAAVKPLIRLVRQLPRYTLQTKSLSERAQRLRHALLSAREPDALIFTEIPAALDVPLHSTKTDARAVRTLTKRLNLALHELQNAYFRLLENCRTALQDSLRVPQENNLREYLSAVAGLLSGQVIDPTLRRLLLAAQEKNKDDARWLEGVVMVIADKPADAWRDDDRLVYEANLSALAQRFLNLHHLIAKMRAIGTGRFDARLVSITRANGNEAREVIWINATEREQVNELKSELQNMPLWQSIPARVRQALLVDLLQEQLDDRDAKSSLTETNVRISIHHRQNNHG